MNGVPRAYLMPTPDGTTLVCLPLPARVFERRAARFRILAPGHAIADYLAALADLAEAQYLACREVPVAPKRDDLSPALPLRLEARQHEETWRRALGVILNAMGKVSLPASARAALARLSAGAPRELETFADALLDATSVPVDLAAAPFVGAALQVCWTMLASQVSAGGVEESPHLCPICGSPPVAGIVNGNDKRRYLTCSLCASEWHLTRVICATCGATDGISYFAVEGDGGAAKAEACQRCRTYLKLFYLEKDPRADAFADDVATLSLDLLMAAEGYSRGGVNLFLLTGDQA